MLSISFVTKFGKCLEQRLQTFLFKLSEKILECLSVTDKCSRWFVFGFIFEDLFAYLISISTSGFSMLLTFGMRREALLNSRSS